MLGPLLVAIDFGDTSHNALRLAIEWANSSHRELVLCHVVPGGRSLPRHEAALAAQADAISDQATETGQDRLAAWAQEARAQGAIVATVQRVADPPASALIDVARENHCSAIVVGTHGRKGLKRAMLGSVAEGVVRNSDLPVLVVPPGAAPPLPPETP